MTDESSYVTMPVRTGRESKSNRKVLRKNLQIPHSPKERITDQCGWAMGRFNRRYDRGGSSQDTEASSNK